jgi:hypothetical protein
MTRDLRYALRLPFGKYRGSTLTEVMLVDPCYIVWLASVKPDRVPRRLRERAERECNTIAAEQDMYGPDDFD